MPLATLSHGKTSCPNYRHVCLAKAKVISAAERPDPGGVYVLWNEPTWERLDFSNERLWNLHFGRKFPVHSHLVSCVQRNQQGFKALASQLLLWPQ